MYPRLTHLNADTSWLVELPRDAQRIFKLLLDPWFEGTQTDFHRLFSRQKHIIPAAIKNASELGTLDAVVISHEFTDHCHEATLRGVSSEVPVFATKNAAAKIRRWKHFTTVHEIPVFDQSLQTWSSTYPEVLPNIHIFRILSPSRLDAGSLHSALLITFPSLIDNSRDALLYTPHGLPSSTPLSFLSKIQPPIRVRVLIHGLHTVDTPWYLGGRVNLGAHNGRALVNQLGPGTTLKYWLTTHDEDKHGEGYVRTVLKRDALQWKDATSRQAGESDALDVVETELNMRCVSLGSGESISLEY